MGIKFELVHMTPKMAAAHLEKNDANRKLREHRAAFIARSIDEGKWITTHQAIAFSPSGRLLDGQHRLRGIVMSNKAVDLWVASNVPEEAFAVMDSGMPRAMNERLKADKTRVSICSTMFRILAPRPIAHEYEIQLLLEMFDGELLILEQLKKSMASKKLQKSSVLSAAVLHLWRHRKNADHLGQTKEMIECALSGRLDDATPVIRSLYRQLIEGVRESGTNIAPINEQFCRAWIGFDVNNSDVAKILVKESTKFLKEARIVFREASEGVFDS